MKGTAVLSWLDELDALLRVAVAALEKALAPVAVLDPFRGLHVTPDDADRLLDRPPGASLMDLEAGLPRPPRPFPELERLEATFGLTAFDSAVLLVAIAPELDLRYERLYGYLQDDISLRRATVDLTLTLFCPDPVARLRARGRFAADAPLRRHDLLRLTAIRDRTAEPARCLAADPQVLRLLTGATDLDERLAGWAGLHPAARRDSRRADPDVTRVARLLRGSEPAVAELRGPGVPAAYVAAALGRPLLSAGGAGPVHPDAVPVLVREAWLRGALLHVDARGDDAVGGLLDRALARFPEPPPCLIVSDRPRALDLSAPDARRRAWLWAECLGDAAGVDVAVLANRYRMSREQIEAAVAAARTGLVWRGGDRLATSDLAAAARAEIRVDLGGLAVRVESPHGWDDLVVPPDVRQQLIEFCQRITGRDQVLERGGFGARLGPAIGVPALFAGPSGGGKTMAAGVVAAELGLDCYKIDLSAVVSKYIGETEKQLEQIFRTAQDADLLLFFDECDALFGKRSEVRDAHDRYANIEIAYLLQRLESYPGPVILATNLLSNLDEAFTRRLAFTVHFPLPGPDDRRLIWERIWPAGTAVAEDVDPDEFARRYPLSGGSIRNIALAGAFLAAPGGGPVTRRHLLHAVRREYQKFGAEPPVSPDD